MSNCICPYAFSPMGVLLIVWKSRAYPSNHLPRIRCGFISIMLGRPFACSLQVTASVLKSLYGSWNYGSVQDREIRLILSGQ